LRQEFQNLIDRQAGVSRKVLKLGVAKDRFKLIFRDRHVGAVAQPGLDLRSEAALLQRRHETGQIMILRLRQYRADHRRKCGTFDRTQRALETVK
jgi:hypothetical protein